ncbi:hypothetical protein OG963_00740 [Streptomyces sp. NBC_01707]|uniref:hypothetical protein n=1 Tax=unclassified Streptomyces TaxID=2593676 RepID=UPI002E13257C|nr:hypothetical protein OG763_43920 [Streptomyces sp. NBC_01230]
MVIGSGFPYGCVAWAARFVLVRHAMAHLRRLPMSELRIDRSFVAQVAVDAEDDRLLFRRLVSLLAYEIDLDFWLSPDE